MAFNFSRFNGASTIRPEVGDIKDWPFMKLEEYVDGAIKVDGFFFTDGEFGRQVVVVGNGAKINMPGYALKRFEDLAEDEEAVAAMLAGEMALTDIKPLDTRRGHTTAFRICNVEELENGQPA